MPLEHPAERLMLIPDRPVPHCAALLIDRLLTTSQAILCRQLPRHRPALPRFHPDMQEPEEVQTCRQHLAVLVLARPPLVAEIYLGGLTRFHPQPPSPQ